MTIIDDRPRVATTICPIRAAEYVRMSTDGQQYSISKQQAAIREFAQQHGMEVVRTYADPGRSGLSLKNRPGLVQLLDDVQNGTLDFAAILVYDVSRWGRFQDTDESGFYEYLCRRAGLRVEYCVELFENDGGPLSAILKNIKRVMAAEYSREQSARVHRATCQAAARGHFPGGTPAYGLRRMLVTAEGATKRILRQGERRAIRQDHIVMTPGPPEEVRTVRRIFRLYVEHKLTPQAIADRLNREGKANRLGNPWRCENVSWILQNERYVGTQLYNQHSQKRIENRRPHWNEPSQWIRKENAFEALIPRALFEAARTRARERTHIKHTEESLLERLRYLWKTHGYLSVELVRAHPKPDVNAFQDMFGGLKKAYEKIGYVQTRDVRDLRMRDLMRPIARTVREALMAELNRRGIRADYDRLHQTVVLAAVVTFRVRALPWWPTPTLQRPRWRILRNMPRPSTFTIFVRMDAKNEHVLDYLVLPMRKVEQLGRSVRLRDRPEYQRYRSESIERVVDHLAGAARRATQGR